MDRRGVLLRLNERLLAAPGSHEGWQAFLLDLCDALAGSGAFFISNDLTADRASVALAARTDPDAVALYNEHWHRVDPWRQQTRPSHLVSGTIVLGDELIPHDEVRRTPYYNDFAHRHDIVRCITGLIEVEPHAFSVLSINGTERRAPFGQEDRTLLRALMGSLLRALDLHRRLGGAERLAAGATSALDRLPHGVVLLSANGRLLFVNREAERILEARDGLTLDRGELRAASPAATARLRTAARDASLIAAGERVQGETTFVLERPSGKRPLSVLAAPLPPQTVFLGIEPAAVAVFVTDPERKPRVESETLSALFGLTPGEADLVAILIDGVSVTDAAIRLRLAPDTLRKRLKAIFQKTDTHRQADLIRLVLLATLPSTRTTG